MADTDPTHDRLAKLLDLTIASVSRIRTGTRHPSLEVMTKIADLFGWPLHLQAEARSAENYAAEFNRHARAWADRNPIAIPEQGDREPAAHGS